MVRPAGAGWGRPVRPPSAHRSGPEPQRRQQLRGLRRRSPSDARGATQPPGRRDLPPAAANAPARVLAWRNRSMPRRPIEPDRPHVTGNPGILTRAKRFMRRPPRAQQPSRRSCAGWHGGNPRGRRTVSRGGAETKTRDVAEGGPASAHRRPSSGGPTLRRRKKACGRPLATGRALTPPAGGGTSAAGCGGSRPRAAPMRPPAQVRGGNAAERASIAAHVITGH